MTPIERFRDENDYIDAIERPDGPVRFVHRTIFAGEIGMSPSLDSRDGVSDRWQYETLQQAIWAFDEWGADDPEPDGWIRHKPSNRRRHYDQDGQPCEEWVAP